MSILHQKARLLGRLFRGAYDGEGTDLGGSEDGPGGGGAGSNNLADATGSGWGGSSGGTGKPGESAMAQSASQQNRYGESMGKVEGFNPNNPSQTVDQLNAAQNVNSALSFGLPMAASMAVPGAGLAMTGMKLGSKMMAGTPVSEILADIAPGIINGKLNALSGGLYGQAGMVSNLSGYLGGPTMPNVGKEIATGILGSGSGKSYAGATTEQAPRESDNGREYAQQGAPAAAQPAPSQPAQPNSDVTFASLGVDSAGWTTASRKYAEAKNGLV